MATSLPSSIKLTFTPSKVAAALLLVPKSMPIPIDDLSCEMIFSLGALLTTRRLVF
jgi:hypothetical protein